MTTDQRIAAVQQSSIIKKLTGPKNQGCPSFADLAKLRLLGDNGKKVPNNQFIFSPTLDESKLTLKSPAINLATALKTKCVIAESSCRTQCANVPGKIMKFTETNNVRNQPVTWQNEQFVLLSNRQIDASLIKSASRTSGLGRVLATGNRKARKLNDKCIKNVLPFAKSNSRMNKSYDFAEPSPDDVIKSRLCRWRKF